MNPRKRAEVLAELGLAPTEPSLEHGAEAPGLDRRAFFQVVATATGGLWLATQFPSVAAAAVMS